LRLFAVRPKIVRLDNLKAGVTVPGFLRTNNPGTICVVFGQNNYYSVPYQLVGQTLRLYSNGALLRISHAGQEVALHLTLNGDKGQYVTQDAHLPPHKQLHGPESLRPAR
jgi:hypothetical protein